MRGRGDPATAPGGQILFFSMATNFGTAALTSDGLSSDARMVIGSGFSPDRGAYALDLVRRNRGLREAMGIELGSCAREQPRGADALARPGRPRSREPPRRPDLSRGGTGRFLGPARDQTRRVRRRALHGLVRGRDRSGDGLGHGRVRGRRAGHVEREDARADHGRSRQKRWSRPSSGSSSGTRSAARPARSPTRSAPLWRTETHELELRPRGRHLRHHRRRRLPGEQPEHPLHDRGDRRTPRSRRGRPARRSPTSTSARTTARRREGRSSSST